MLTLPKKYLILIVEDEMSLRGALCIKFKKEGFSVIEARDGELGLALALKREPSIILLDMVMPKLDGISMLKKLRNGTDWSRTVPVILLTNIGVDSERGTKTIPEDLNLQYLVKSDWKIGDLVEKVKETLTTHR